MNTPRPFPLPEDIGRKRHDPASFIKAATAFVIAAVDSEPVAGVAKRLYEGDRRVDWLVRSSVSPATVASLGGFTQTAGLNVVSALGPASAGALLLDSGVTFNFDGNAGIYISSIVAAPGSASFLAEDGVIPVRQLTLDNNTLVPRSLKVITTLTREVAQYSVPVVQTMVQTALADSMVLAFDAALFDTAAADAARPAGLRNGIAGATASDSTNRYEAMMEDLETLIGAVSAVANNGPIALVMSPTKATALRLAAKASPFPYPIYATSGLATGIVCAVAVNSLVSAFDPQPRFSTSFESTLHMDSSPSALSAEGTPNTVAASARSLYQTDTIALKMTLECAWALRNAAGLSWLTTTAW